jgi:ribonuclease Z
MATLYLLGTGAALSDPHRTTTMLAVHHPESVVVIDCGGDVVQRLMSAGLDLDRIEAMIITHEHADHVSGFPLFMEKIWLAGRRRPIPVYGIEPALAQAQRAWESFDTSSWEGLPPIDWREVPHEEGAELLEDDHWRITVTPVEHSKPTIGLRVEDKDSGGVLAYSCDTAPTPRFVDLARGADLMVHEATGEGPGHSTAVEAANVARHANAKRLLLVHLPPAARLTSAMMAEARDAFPALERGAEGGQYEF